MHTENTYSVGDRHLECLPPAPWYQMAHSMGLKCATLRRPALSILLTCRPIWEERSMQ